MACFVSIYVSAKFLIVSFKNLESASSNSTPLSLRYFVKAGSEIKSISKSILPASVASNTRFCINSFLASRFAFSFSISLANS